MKQDAIKHFIGGKDTTSGEIGTATFPLSPDETYSFYIGDSDAVDEAVTAAKAAMPSWASKKPADRAQYLIKMADWLVKEYGDEGKPSPLKQVITRDVGKPLPEADIEVIETSDFIRYFAEAGPTVLSERKEQLDANLWPTKKSITIFEPKGVVAIIKPWNYPLEMIAWSLAPALVAGNTIVIKPSEKSSLVAAEIVRMTRDCDIPAGVVNVVFGDGSTGAELVRHRDVQLVSFTGSTAVGKIIAQICAEQLKPCALELGGNDAAIILDDADIETTANGLIWGAFCNAGQVCVGVKHAYVASSVYSLLLDTILEKAKKLRLGTDVGPIVDRKQLDAISELVTDAIALGAKPILGGCRSTQEEGLFYEPTILVGVPDSARLYNEECFGPVLPLWPFDDVDSVIDRINSSEFGLGSSIWTKDNERADKIARRLNVGMTWVNDVNVAFPQAVWSGRKCSGLGFELSQDSILEYCDRRHLCFEMGTETARAWWYPY